MIVSPVSTPGEMTMSSNRSRSRRSWCGWRHCSNGPGPTAGKHVLATVNSLSRVTTKKTFELRERVYLAAPVSNEKTGKTLAVVVVAESLEPYESTRSAVLIGLILLGVAAPAELVERALAPLVDNALKYAASTVTVATENHDRSVRITVSDDGPGVAFDDLDDVFRAGARSSASTGAGLALSRRVARTLGGDIQLRSGSKPTTFVLEVPRH